MRRGVVVAILTVAVAACSGHGASRIAGNRYPATYAVEYHDDVNGVSHWEVLVVHRPFTGSDLTYSSPQPPARDATPSGGYISTETALYDVDQTGVREVSGRQPGPPSGDEYVGSELGELVGRGLAVNLKKQQVIAGHPCALYRFASPPSGPIAAVTAQAPNHDDLCIASDGLVLGETWTYHSMVVERRTATVVAIGWFDQIPRANLPMPPSTDQAKPAPAGAPTVTAIDQTPATPIASPIATPPRPIGFQPGLLPQLFRLPNPGNPATLAARSVVWTFTNLADHMITVEVGSESGGRLPWAAHDTVTAPVALPSLGTATSALRSDGAEIRVVLRSGGWLRIHGTVPLQTLISYAGQLRLR